MFSLGTVTPFCLAMGRAPYRDGGAGSAMEELVRAATGDLDVCGLPPELDGLGDKRLPAGVAIAERLPGGTATIAVGGQRGRPAGQRAGRALAGTRHLF